MDQVKEYVKDEKVPIEKLARLNYMRNFKKMYLPCELVEIDGSSESVEKRNHLEISCIRWKMNFTEVKKPSKNTVEEWNKFVRWLSQQNVQTVYHFEEQVIFKYM